MKNDYAFKFVAAIILAGVIVALFSPTHATNATHHASADLTPAAPSTE